jgi:hypothetical protein
MELQCHLTLSTGKFCTQEEAYVSFNQRKVPTKSLTDTGGRKVVDDSDDEEATDTKYEFSFYVFDFAN